MSWKTSHNTKQSVESDNAENTGQIAQAGKDLVQIGRDYIQHIYEYYRSHNWISLITALILLLIFFYGVIVIGNTLHRLIGIKPLLFEAAKNNSLPQGRDVKIKGIEGQVEYLLQTNELVEKVWQQVKDLQKSLDDWKKELDRQKELVQQQNDQTQALGTQINNLKDQLSEIRETPPARRGTPVSTTPPPGTAPKSWCLQAAEIARIQRERFRWNTSATKAQLEEKNCGFWGVRIP